MIENKLEITKTTIQLYIPKKLKNVSTFITYNNSLHTFIFKIGVCLI